MNYKMMGRFNSQILAIEAVFMLTPLVISLFTGDSKGAAAFSVTLVITALISLILYLISRGAKRDFYSGEGLLCVGLSWIIISILGALPFWLSRQIPSYIDALFEIVSGFTTTGSSVIPDLSVMTKSMLYWRSFSHWLGGMGVLVFLLAIVPVSGKNEGLTMHLLRAESPGPDVGKLVPRMKHTAIILYTTYVILTVLNVIFYLLGGMTLFEAVCSAFGTAGTGGFGIYNDSFAGFSPYLQWVCTVFMLLFGVNFSCYHLLMLKNIKSVFRDEELRLYFGVVLGSIVLIVINLGRYYATFGETLRHAAFQVTSIITTTGFATTDFDLWPAFSKGILLVLMIMGACAGSTGGGLKCARVLLLFKGIKRNISHILHPHQVSCVRINGKKVDDKTISNTNTYFAVYMVIVFVSFLLVSLDGFSVTTNLSAVLACFNNIGPGFDAVGPTCNFASFSVLSKLILIFDMLAGRLEVFPVLVLFFPGAWRRR